MLDEIYNWFTEKFDTADLKDAKALLEELCVEGWIKALPKFKSENREELGSNLCDRKRVK